LFHKEQREFRAQLVLKVLRVRLALRALPAQLALRARKEL
jgi:hypothetical protein